MAQPWEWLNKYLAGQNFPIVDSEKRYLTKGLFGKGGEYGQGGLFTTPPEDSGKGMLDLFSNLPAVTGFELIQKGFEGKPIEQTLLPAFKSGLVTTSAVEKVKASKLKQKFIKEYKDKVPPEDMEMFLAFPKEYMGGLIGKKFRTTKRTVSDEVLAVYDKVKGLDRKGFNEIWENLSKAEKSLYKNKIEGKEDYLDALILGRVEELNTPILLDDTGKPPNPDELTKNQTYRIGDTFWRWDGEDMKRIPPPQ